MPAVPQADIVAAVTELIASCPTAANKTFGPDTALFGHAIIDSLDLINVIGAIETRYGLALGPDDLTAANFMSVNSIAALIARRIGA